MLGWTAPVWPDLQVFKAVRLPEPIGMTPFQIPSTPAFPRSPGTLQGDTVICW